MENKQSRINGKGIRRRRAKVYRPQDCAHRRYEDIADPGQYPFTRGVYPDMYRKRLWTMRQYAGYATAEESNRRFRYLLSQGTTGLSVAFDLPTQIGLDSDAPLSGGEVGRVGVAIDSLDDMVRLFKQIPLDAVSTSMTINSTAAIMLALYLAVARKQQVDWGQLRGTVQNDVLKEYIARGTYIFPPGPSLRIITDIVAFCQREVPHWNTISVSGYHIREAGSTAAQEIAFAIANGEAYIRAALKAGLALDDFAPRVSFFFNVCVDFFEEVAKFRAARRIWARLMRERFQASDPRSCMMRFHVQTAGSSLTAQQPDNNVVRVSLQALAAVLGGTQSLHTCGRDEALALPTEESVRLALRTQQIIAFESGVASVVDPLGGSWYVESLTADLEAEAEKYLKKIRDQGGMLKAIASGYVQKEIQDSAYRYQKALESGQETVIGVNRFSDKEGNLPQLFRLDPHIEKRQTERLQELRQRRDPARVQRDLEQLRRCARGSENLMPAIIEAVEGLATVGEITDSLRDVFGEHQESIVI